MGQTKTGYWRRNRVGEVASGVPRYEHHRLAKKPPEFGQPDKGRKWTIHADPALHAFLREHGYADKAAHLVLDLLCTRIEAWFWESFHLYYFNGYRVWVVSIESGDAPFARPSLGLLQGYHLTLKPRTHELGGSPRLIGEAKIPWHCPPGVPQMAAHPEGPNNRTPTKELIVRSDNYHLVTADNPALPDLDDPPPTKPGYYLYYDTFTLLSPPLTADTPAPTSSTWRFSWSAPANLHAMHRPNVPSLPGISFSIPTSVDDVRPSAIKLDENRVPMQGVAIVCEGLPATYPLARRASQVQETQVVRPPHARDFADAEGGGFDLGGRDECSVM
ncbi:hypothetical protein JCM10449v2_005768 [Rhodotorula kratochvilovae]